MEKGEAVKVEAKVVEAGAKKVQRMTNSCFIELVHSRNPLLHRL